MVVVVAVVVVVAAAVVAVAVAVTTATVVVGAAVVANTALRGRPERVFVSVDESTGRSTMSFQPPDVGTPVLFEDDHKGVRAMTDAKSISEKYPGCTVHGPHFHAARPAGRMKPRRRPAPNE